MLAGAHAGKATGIARRACWYCVSLLHRSLNHEATNSICRDSAFGALYLLSGIKGLFTCCETVVVSSEWGEDWWITGYRFLEIRRIGASCFIAFALLRTLDRSGSGSFGLLMANHSGLDHDEVETPAAMVCRVINPSIDTNLTTYGGALGSKACHESPAKNFWLRELYHLANRHLGSRGSKIYDGGIGIQCSSISVLSFARQSSLEYVHL